MKIDYGSEFSGVLYKHMTNVLTIFKLLVCKSSLNRLGKLFICMFPYMFTST